MGSIALGVLCLSRRDLSCAIALSAIIRTGSGVPFMGFSFPFSVLRGFRVLFLATLFASGETIFTRPSGDGALTDPSDEGIILAWYQLSGDSALTDIFALTGSPLASS